MNKLFIPKNFGLGASVMALTVLCSSQAQAAIALFDINGTAGGPTATGFAALDADNGSASQNGYTLTLSGVQAGDSRDRGTAATTGGVDNNDNQVPVGTFAAMYQDFVFDRTGGFTIDLSGLEINSTFNIIAWSYDSGATGNPTAVDQDFSVGAVVANLQYEGDNGGGAGLDPNTATLADYSVTFQVTSDGTGNASFTTISNGTQGARLNGVSVELVPEPSSALLGMLGALGLLRRRR